MIFDSDMKIFDWKGEVVVENPPAAALTEALMSLGKGHMLNEVMALIELKDMGESKKPVSVGRLIAPWVAMGAGLEESAGPACYSLSVQLHAGGKVELSNADADLIRKAVENSPAPHRWVKGLVAYLLDPESVPEEHRKVFAAKYATALAKNDGKAPGSIVEVDDLNNPESVRKAVEKARKKAN